MMEFIGKRVLLTDGGARQTLTILHSLKELGCNVSVICDSKWSVCYASKLPDRKVLYTYNGNAKVNYSDYGDFILNLVRTEEYDVLLPVAEMSTDTVTKNEQEIGKYVKIACAPRKAYIKAFNKQITFDTAIEYGVPCPYTRKDSQDIEEFLKNTKFPIIIKPRQGMGSVGFHKFINEAEFRHMLKKKDFDPDKYIIQEFVSHDKRIDAFVFIDQYGEVKTSIAIEALRWYPLDAGSATFTGTVNNPDIVKYGCQILKALKWQGFADVSFMIEKITGKPKLMEINGRIPADMKLSWYCGYNVARQLLEMSYGEDVIAYPDNNRFSMMARHSQADFMWFLKSKDRFRARPSWFSQKNTTDLVYWKEDPKPFWVYTFSGIFKYKEFMKERKH